MTEKQPLIINITNKPAGSDETHELQSIYPVDELIKALGNYLSRVLRGHDPIETIYFQQVLSRKASNVDELQALSFEPNQRVGELIALVSLVGSINKINEKHDTSHNDYVPAWQKAGQNDSIKKFSGKGSWDGFIYEHVSRGDQALSQNALITGVEIKSLMVDPRENFTNLNDLLTQRMPKFSKHFQIENSMAVVLVPPYSSTTGGDISFDLKRASEDITSGAGKTVSAIVFIEYKNHDGKPSMSTLTWLINKNQQIIDDKIDSVEMVRMPFYS